MSLDDDLAGRLADIPFIDTTIIGTFVEASGSQAVVDVGDARVTIPMLGYTFPVPGDPVRILRVNKQTFLLGPVAPRAVIGKVTSTGSPRCTVEYPAGSGVTKQMGYPSNITPAVNDVVLIDWTSGGTIIDKITIAPGVVVPPTPPPPPASVTQTQVFTAVDSGTFYVPGSRWNTPEVWAVTTGNNVGAWFYGTKIRDTILDAAVINAVEIYLPLFYDIGAAPVSQAHTSAYKPGGNVSVTGGTHALAPRSGWSPLPSTFLDYLKVNDGGIALVGGGWAKYRGINVDGLTGALRVTYTA